MSHRFCLPCQKSKVSAATFGVSMNSHAVSPATTCIQSMPLTLLVLAAMTIIHPTQLLAKTVQYKTASHPGLVLIKGTSTLHNWTIK